jgi:hypothetical protein
MVIRDELVDRGAIVRLNSHVFPRAATCRPLRSWMSNHQPRRGSSTRSGTQLLGGKQVFAPVADL